MMNRKLSLALTVFLPLTAFAAPTAFSGPQATVYRSLSENRVVKAALAEAREGAGATSCEPRFNEFAKKHSPRNEVIYDYKIQFLCRSADTAGLVEVEGTWESAGPQEFTLNLHFGG